MQDLLLACPRLLAEDDAHYEAVTKPRMLHLSAVFDGQLQAHSNAGLEKRECAKSVARDLMKEA